MKLKNIKETFDNREIKPSASSWDALSSRLDQEEKKSKKPVVIYWLGAIAAVLIAAVLLYPSLSDDLNINDESTHQIVITEDAVKEESGKLNPEVIENELVNEQVTEVVSIANTAVKKELEVKVQSKNKSSVKGTKKSKPSSISSPQEVEIAQVPLSGNKELLIDSQEETTIAHMETNVIVEKTLTAEEEMELLLNEALQKTQPTEIAAKSIDPNKLLREAEWDVESDRRSRIQNKLQDGWDFIKSEAVTMVVPHK
ncbi:MAG: hypothetical protein ACSHWW_09835 [Nonlabens sp.]|uniref:hypothetical protein n=1 Tax=Nonlabens sp. TaxID=1888209 RepID=UPI003EFAB5C6